MDEFVKDNLNAWNLAEWIPAFEEQRIDKESFFLLDANSVTSLIPVLGPRLKFQLHLKKLLEDSSSTHETTILLQTIEAPEETLTRRHPVDQPRALVEDGPTFNICEILSRIDDGKAVVRSLQEDQCISSSERMSMVRILVSHLMERFGENPTTTTKLFLAMSIVDQFPCLRDPQGTGYDAWFTQGRSHRPATGYLEERLRNIRKRLRRGQGRNTPRVPQEPQPQFGRPILPEPELTGEEVTQMSEWLKNNMWPAATVGQYMLKTAIHRAQWIREDGAKELKTIVEEFPRLLDTPGMIAQDFSLLHPEAAGKLTETWNPQISAKIIRLAKKEKKAGDLLTNIDSLSTDKKGDIALQLLPILLPTTIYKIGKKIVRPTILECCKAFIDVQPPGTNLVQYLTSTRDESPHVLMLGDGNQCSQAYVVVKGEALEHPSLLAAVDGCFKAYYVLDLNYPPPCSQVWEFFQSTIFDIPVTKESKAVQLLRSQLAMMG